LCICCIDTWIEKNTNLAVNAPRKIGITLPEGQNRQLKQEAVIENTGMSIIGLVQDLAQAFPEAKLRIIDVGTSMRTDLAIEESESAARAAQER
jgi:hypothetical protein